MKETKHYGEEVNLPYGMSLVPKKMRKADQQFTHDELALLSLENEEVRWKAWLELNAKEYEASKVY